MNQIVDVTKNTLTSTPTLIPYSHQDLADMFQELHAAYQNAETWAKRVENIIDDVPIAAINQMRYAGYHISKVLSKSDFFPSNDPNNCLVNIDDLRSAYKHLLRAYYDSLDQLTQQLAAQLADYQSKFQELNIIVTDHFPNFFNWVDEVNDIGQFDISEDSQSVNQFAISHNDRQAHYAKIAAKIDDLDSIKKNFRAMAHCLVIQAKRIDAEMKALEQAQLEAQESKTRELESLKAARSSKNWTVVAAIVAVIGVSFSIYFGLNTSPSVETFNESPNNLTVKKQ
ncbi:hypothetical protein ABEF79_15125 [Acinetobacter sp. ANC 7454]|uniref:hypothetical protein n=1 Tax=Acinetobacter thermotolerans TaxID=3151487 RepID=UPI00325BFC74